MRVKEVPRKNTQKLKKILLNHQFNHVSGNLNVSAIPTHWADDELFYDINLTAIICSHFVDGFIRRKSLWRQKTAETREIISGYGEEKPECVIKDTSSRNRAVLRKTIKVPFSGNWSRVDPLTGLIEARSDRELRLESVGDLKCDFGVIWELKLDDKWRKNDKKNFDYFVLSVFFLFLVVFD